MRRRIALPPAAMCLLLVTACSGEPQPAQSDEAVAPAAPYLALSDTDPKLAAIAAFVNGVCRPPEQGGYRTDTELKAAAGAKGRLVSAKIAEVNAEASAARKAAVWRGVDQDALAAAMRDQATCAPKVLDLMLSRMGS